MNEVGRSENEGGKEKGFHRQYVYTRLNQCVLLRKRVRRRTTGGFTQQANARYSTQARLLQWLALNMHVLLGPSS